MNPWFGKAVFFVGIIGMVVVRTPHIRRSTRIRVVKSRQGVLDNVLVAFVSVGLLLPLIGIATSALAFADYPLRPISFATGLLCYALGLWCLHRSHVDLGTNWSNTLEVREEHRLVADGIYRRVRHPMYLALLLYSLGQALALPNWIAGPSFLLPFALLVAVRLGPEERMMVEEFGKAYEVYRERTKRLVPGIW